MANVTTQNPAITSRFLANQAAQNAGMASLAKFTGDTTIPPPSLETDGVPFYGLRTAVIAMTSVGNDSTAAAYGMFRAFDGSFIWTELSGASPLTVTDGTIGNGWNTDAGCPERVAVEFAAGAGVNFVISIGGHQ